MLLIPILGCPKKVALFCLWWCNAVWCSCWDFFLFFAEANVIYLETPAGVGYSYSADAAYYQGVDDKMTGAEHSVLD